MVKVGWMEGEEETISRAEKLELVLHVLLLLQRKKVKKRDNIYV